MRYHYIMLLVLSALFGLMVQGCSQESAEEPRESVEGRGPGGRLAFSSGPEGGTFKYVAGKLAQIISQNGPETVWVSKSSGSADNLRRLDSGESDMGIVYAGDGFLGRNARLPGDPRRYESFRSLAPLYGAPAQLVVRSDSDIKNVRNLEGKVVAIGAVGSGAALSAERFFRYIDLWQRIDVKLTGYSRAAKAFLDGEVDAFWILAGTPNDSINQAAAGTGIRVLDVHVAALKSGFYEVYPFYTMATIPAATYAGQQDEVLTFQDTAMWCVRKGLPESLVFSALKAVYSRQGLRSLGTAHKAAWSMGLENGVQGVSVPLHPGAYRFWNDQGVFIPHQLEP